MTATKTASKAVEAADVVEDVKEVVEDTVDLVGGKTSWLKTTNAKLFLIGLSGLALGAVASYAINVKRLEKKYQAIADEQVADVKERYSARRVIPAKPDLDTLADNADAQDHAEEIIRESGYRNYNAPVSITEDPIEEQTVTEAIMEAAAPIKRNVFESDNPDTYFDFEEEMERREARPDDPFVITQEEFNDNDTGNDQTSLTYYDGDDVLTDSNDQVVDNIDKTVGVENMLRFGHGSGDPEIVYIRNPKLGLDIEVAHSDGKFAKEVLGFDDELQHSSRRPRKFRDSDE